LLSDDDDHRPAARDVPLRQQPAAQLSTDFVDQVRQSLLELRLGPREFNAYSRSQFMTSP